MRVGEDSDASRLPLLAPAVVRLRSERGSCIACGRHIRELRCEACGATRGAGRYLAMKVLGERPFSRTYLALDPKYDRHVVLKELWFAHVPTVEVLEAFERETRLLEAIEHRRIPRLLKSFSLGEGAELRWYLVREYVRGQSLARAYRRGISEKDARHVARQVLRVLRVLHAQHPPVVHRDLRPHHLLRHPNGDIHLVGFGAARWIEDGLTFDGTLVGQPGYAPLEQLGGTLEPTADLHGLGAALLHLLTGVDPFHLMPDGERLRVPRGLGVSREFASFLRQLVAPPAQRYPSAAVAYEALVGRNRVAEVLERAAAWLRHR